MTGGNAKAFGGYQSLAVLLEFLTRLEESSVKTKVITEIEEEVKKYFKDHGKFGNPTTGYLFETIKSSKELRMNIVKSGESYEHYKTDFDNNANKYTELLINNIFALFGCLYYMYFECCRDCTYIDGGGEWHDERCDGSSGEKYLNEWLRDETGKTGRMIQRGFKQDELSNKTGNDLFPSSGSQALLDYLQGAQLQSALFFMLFLPHHTKWNNAQSGHAVLFLEAFSEKVTGGDEFFKHQNHDGISMDSLKPSCTALKDKIRALTSSNTIVPVATENKTVKYRDLLDEKRFWNYIEWLKENLKMLIDSLQAMANDASNWDYTELITSETFGPYPWGFTFKDQNWEQKKGQLQQQLEQEVSQLTKALRTLKDALQSISMGPGISEKATEEPSTSTNSNNSTTSTVSINSAKEPSNSTDSNDSSNSTASTLGGVAGGLGAAAATAGAAYAGSSFLGPVAEAVGKFFKGLLF